MFLRCGRMVYKDRLLAHSTEELRLERTLLTLLAIRGISMFVLRRNHLETKRVAKTNGDEKTVTT